MEDNDYTVIVPANIRNKSNSSATNELNNNNTVKEGESDKQEETKQE